MKIKTEEYRDYNIEIHTDEDPTNPREYFDHPCKMVCWHGRHNLGDKHDFTTPDDFRTFSQENPLISLPLILLDHSGLSMSVSKTWPYDCPWDAGQVGWIYITIEDALKEFDWKKMTDKRREKVIERLSEEVDVYNTYLRGDVVGFVIKKDDEDINSCWGFYDCDYMLTEAKEIVDQTIKENTKKHAAQLKAYIRHKVSLDKRKVFEA